MSRKSKKLVCPECKSSMIWKDGIRYTNIGKIQRFICRSCGFRFSESSLQKHVKFNIASKSREFLDSCSDLTEGSVSETDLAVEKILNDSFFSVREDVSPHAPSSVTKLGKRLNKLCSYSSKRQESDEPKRQACAALARGAKNLAGVSREEKRAAGATKSTSERRLTQQEIKGKLVEFAWFMQKEGYKPTTIKARMDCMKNLINRGLGPDLFDPEVVKGFIAKQNWGDGYKANVILSYTTFLAMHGIYWNPPRYDRPDRVPYIPLESELDQLIMSTGKRMSIFLQALKETAADPSELQAIEWTDVNPQNRTITINHPVKGHKPRMIAVSRELIERINTLPKVNKRVFQSNIRSLLRNFYEQRKVAAKKFNNPRLLKITFTTFRHWKATMEYHKTKDILWVMKLLGHNSLRTTLIYIDLEKALFRETNDEFTVRVAENLEEACKLLEVGFEYVTEMDGKRIFRKRK